MMILGSVAALAAESYPITITNANATAAHTYTAYQVFSGTLSADGKLANIDWGSGVNGAALLAALKASTAFGATNPFAAATKAEDVADVVATWQDNSAMLEAFADVVGANLATGIASTHEEGNVTSYTINATAPGYYIVKETGVNPENNRSSSGFMIKVVGPATMNVKDSPFSPDKNIAIANGANSSSYTKVKENTANVGDTVTFVVDTITVPNVDGYKTFKFVMKDTLPKGLTFGEVLSVKLDKTGDALASSAYTVTTSKDATTGETELRIAIKNALTVLKPYEGKEVEILYTATVNKDANFGSTGNENEVVFEFTNNPDDEHEGDDFGPEEPHGETPESKTKTYVTKIKVLKVDGEGEGANPVAGAVFTLSGTSKNVVVTTGDQFVKDATKTEGHYYLLKDGTYTLTAPTDGTADKYENINETYSKESYERAELTGANNVDVEAVSPATGVIDFEGLKPGTYTLTETGAPAGYNKITSPITFEIGWDSATKNFKIEGTAPAGVVLKDDGTIEVTVVNKSGSTLPSTGGIGTSIFSIGGSVLVLAAAILLITKRRMSIND